MTWPPPNIDWFYHDDFTAIACGDCREVLPKLPKVDLVLTDPPYGINLQPQRGITKAIKGDTKREAKALTWAVAEHTYVNSPDNSVHLFFGGWSETWVKDVLSEWFTVKGCIVWKKNVFGIGYHLRPQHEFLWVCHKGEPTPPEEAPSDVWECPKVQAPSHSCEKPTALLTRAINYAGKPQTILDPFMGSGTTLVAAKQLGRRAIGIEINRDYCQIAVDRLSQEYLPLLSEPKPTVQEVGLL